MSDTDARAPLRVHLTAQRRSREIDDALTRLGAQVFHCPALVVVPAERDEQIARDTRAILAARPEAVLITTGVGLRAWLAAADALELGEPLRRLLGQTRLLARGAKAHGAIRAAGLTADWVAPGESTSELIEHLAMEGLSGRTVAIQHHGMDDGRDARDLRERGAQVHGVVLYRYAEPADPKPVLRSVREAADGSADAVLFTSAGAAAAWLKAADAEQRRRLAERSAAGNLGLFAVGAVTAAPLREHGLTVQHPERFRLGAMLRQVGTWAQSRSPRERP